MILFINFVDITIKINPNNITNILLIFRCLNK
ncbi:MAG: hypothetical protein BWX96_02490 [Bacteroidetes bacterium ADurb.Bin145]|nr:MAG: hypothetical protein BWX96_02490 [Bacteroidetes bacterium ADurb.Bin145]